MKEVQIPLTELWFMDLFCTQWFERLSSIKDEYYDAALREHKHLMRQREALLKHVHKAKCPECVKGYMIGRCDLGEIAKCNKCDNEYRPLFWLPEIGV